ncbi:MAG: hypothetical protein IPK66_12150 [Rhodospirillales bacterium]|nr:hypothetical protein [Rhodospirillales bacterium]
MKRPGGKIDAALKAKIALGEQATMADLTVHYEVHPTQIMLGRSRCWTMRHGPSTPGWASMPSTLGNGRSGNCTRRSGN